MKIRLPKIKIRGIVESKILSVKELQFERQALPSFLIFLVLVLLGVSVFLYWNGRKPKASEEETITIAVTIFPIADILENVIGDTGKFEVVTLIPSEVSPHLFEASEETRSSIDDADIVVKIGVHFDDWIDELALEDSAVVDLSTVVELQNYSPDHDVSRAVYNYSEVCRENNGKWLEEYNECENVDKSTCDAGGGEYASCASPCRHDEDPESCIQVCVEVCNFSDVMNGQGTEGDMVDEGQAEIVDPHYWLSIDNAKAISRTMYSIVSQVKPGFQESYYRNLEKYLDDLDDTHSYIDEEANKLWTRKFIVEHDGFGYFAEKYGLEYKILRENAASDVTNVDLENVLKYMNLYNLEHIYRERQIGGEAIVQFADENNLELRFLDPIGGNTYTESYIDMMKFNIDSLRGITFYE